MSGIVGILNLDGSPVERKLLEGITSFLSFRGPDAQETWTAGPVGFGHTLLKTTFESEKDRQPLSVDGLIWITADARIDGQVKLREQLQAKGRDVPTEATDAELILHAYHAWSEDCLHYLIGDFAFAIWDGTKRRLFCARDHFGVKPFFFAQVGKSFVFSNTLNAIRRHPAVSNRLNDLAISDFLMFEMNQDAATTAFADIQRLAPAHRLSLSPRGLDIAPYWSLQRNLEIIHCTGKDCVEHFSALLKQAVADRLRTDKVGIEMSGGLDSTSVAAVAKQLLAQSGRPHELCAHSLVFDRLIPDRERQYSRDVAEYLGIPIHYLAADTYTPYERCDELFAALPEPIHDPELAKSADFMAMAAAHSRVMLTGWDGDALLTESPKTFFRYLWYRRELPQLFFTMLQYVSSHPKPAARGSWNSLRRLLRKQRAEKPVFPPWLNRDLVTRLDLRERWETFQTAEDVAHPLRPYAYRTYDLVLRLSNFFDCFDAGVTRQPLEYRHPMFDLRLINFCLSLPPLPWCASKEMLRIAMRGQLPENVRMRPKTSVAGWPFFERCRTFGYPLPSHFASRARIYKYVEKNIMPAVSQNTEPAEIWVNLRPLSLDYWLKSSAN